ncbi:hypothetical protein Q7689_27780, partial [Nocardiopsis tropica]|nr:hypothetical protein [Nocardiopsis tropica]
MSGRPVPTEISDLPYAEDLRPFSMEQLHDDPHEAVHFDGGGFDRVHLTGARFIESAFTSARWSGGSLRRCRFTDVWLHTVRVTGTDIAESVWLDSSIVDSVFAGAASFDCEVRRVVFSSC